MNDFSVNIWKEDVVIPTYETGIPDKNPMFFEKRVYQGSSGVVYPNPVIDKIYDEKKDKRYIGLFLENEYLKIMILPELGGRVQMAYDKIKERHFIYYNRVIKPALVGLCGPWISGGIEFNWPQHHRPSTFEPIDFCLKENEDGSKTIWVNEIEKMFGTKGMTGFSLHPGKAYLEIKTILYNRTSLPQTFLWWANPAVKVSDNYQSVFPPDVNAVFDHGKRDVSTFPIATGTYYKVDYAPGTDISRYKNIPVPTSYMAIHSDYDFVGGYEHDSKGGVLHVADHRVSPGKKQWTWGYSDFGKAWDRNLTDEDGPYIEIMTGVYTDNQPDFSWLMPCEEKQFTQYFLPYSDLGVVKNATKDLLVNVEKEGAELVLKVYATSAMKNLQLTINRAQSVLLTDTFDVAPASIYSSSFVVDVEVTADNILLLITETSGKELIRYEPLNNRKNEVPKPAKAALEPAEIENNEQLFLTGVHLEQYRHATYSAVPYYEEALRRDVNDIRNNNALGSWYLRRGQFAKSESYFRRAIDTLTERNSNPYDSEPYYNLGLSLKYQNRMREVYDAFYKSTWSNACKSASFFSIAQIDIANGNYKKALEHIEMSLDCGAGNSKARLLKVSVLRKLEKFEMAIAAAAEALQRDCFNLAVYFELSKTNTAQGNEEEATVSLVKFIHLAGNNANTYIEYALDYIAANLFSEGKEMLERAIDTVGLSHPMVYYYLGFIHYQTNDVAGARHYFEQAATADSSYCFPNRLEDIAVLQTASFINPKDAKAPYYLGNLWYDKRQYNEALEQWDLSAQRDDTFATVFRNLGIAYFNKKGNEIKALNCYEKAFHLNTSDARVLMELDQLYKRLNVAPSERLAFLEKHLPLVELRDDLYLERLALHNLLGNYEKAHTLIMLRKFHPWEGGEGKVSGQYVFSLVEMAKQSLSSLDFSRAINLLINAQAYPDNLGEGKLYGVQENDIFYWLGRAYEGLEDTVMAKTCFKKATKGLSEPNAAIFYNDQPADKILYQGLAWQKLGVQDEAKKIFNMLVKYAEVNFNAEIKIDYFAVSLPDLLIFEDDLKMRNQIHCNYVKGLGYYGLGEPERAEEIFKNVLSMDAQHFGAAAHLQMAQQMQKHDTQVV